MVMATLPAYQVPGTSALIINTLGLVAEGHGRIQAKELGCPRFQVGGCRA